MKNTFTLLALMFLLMACNQTEDLKIKPLSGELRDYIGKPTLFINETPTDPSIYGLTTCPGGRMSWGEAPQYNIKRFSNEANYTLFQGELFMRDIFPNEDYTLDIDMVRRQVRGFIDANPNAAVFIRLRCNASPQWNLNNKDQCTAWANGEAAYMEEDGLHRWDDHDTETSLRYSLASKKWRADMVKKIEILCQELAQTPEGNAVVGIQIATGIYGENHYWGFLFNEPDVSQPMQAYFKQWLSKKYENNEALQTAWADENVTLGKATVPGMKERFPDDMDGIFRNPKTNRQVIDYNQCQHELIVENIELFCKTAKENWPRPLITGTFYGYFFYCFGRHAAGGHLAMQKMLNSPWVDYLSAPMTYANYSKMMGGSGHARGISDACRMHGKLWLDEYDNSSSLHPKNMGEYLSDFTQTIDEDKAMIRRSLAGTYTRGGGRWMYDFGPRTIGGWWTDSTLLEDLAAQKSIFEKYSSKSYSHEADVLVVYDSEVYYYLAANWHIDVISHTGVEWAATDLFQSGVAFDRCLLFDLKQMDLEKYKAVLFVNTFKMTNEERTFIQEKVSANGRTVIWNYLPGYCNDTDLDINNVKELVQMDIEKTTPTVLPPYIQWIENKSETFGIESKYEAFFEFERIADPSTLWQHKPSVYAITDGKAEVIGTYAGAGQVAIARKKMEDWTSVYCSLPLQNENIMRDIFKEAGCHIYIDNGDAINVGGGIFVIHTAKAGKKTIQLLNGKTVTFDMPANSTYLIDNETGEIILK